MVAEFKWLNFIETHQMISIYIYTVYLYIVYTVYIVYFILLLPLVSKCEEAL